jgi:hypothetical protein
MKIFVVVVKWPDGLSEETPAARVLKPSWRIEHIFQTVDTW